VQETVLEVSALDLHMVGKLEHALEGARSDALIKGLALGIVGLGLLLAANRQGVLLRHDVEFGLGKACYRYADAIRVIAGALDVVGRVARDADVGIGKIVKKGEETIKADGRTIKGSKVESSHGISSLSDMRGV